MLDAIKTKRALQAVTKVENLREASAAEKKKKHHTPPFVQHCVTAIANDPEKMKSIKGSPFGICWAEYEKKPGALDAQHPQTSAKEKNYEKTLAKLKDDIDVLRAGRQSRRDVVFEHREHDHRNVRFSC